MSELQKGESTIEQYIPLRKCEILNKICEIMTTDFIHELKSDIGVSDLEGLIETAKEDKDKLDKVLGLCNLARHHK